MERSRSRVPAAAPRCRADFRRTVSSRPPAEGGGEGGGEARERILARSPSPAAQRPDGGGRKIAAERSGSDGRTDGRTDGGFGEARGLPRAVLLPVDSRQPTYPPRRTDE